MMRDLNECKAEVFRRSEEKKKRQRRNRRRIVAGCACLCLCLTFVGVGLSLSGAPGGEPVSPVSDETKPAQPAEQSRPTEASNHTEPKPVVITSNVPDTYNHFELQMIPSKSQIFISPTLRELMERDYETEVVFRVLVRLLTTHEDYDEARYYSDSDEELTALYKKLREAGDAYEEARERFKQNKDESKRTELLAELNEKKEYMNACSKTWSTLREKIERAYLNDIYSARLAYAYTVGAENVRYFEGSSDMSYSGYVMELSADMINKMAAQGGYDFRMAPPRRIGKYDVRISDSLTTLLDNAAEDDLLHVAVVCTADYGNFFASTRGITVNGGYNANLFQPWKISPSDFGPTGSENYDSLVDHVNAVIERHGLADRHIVNERHPDVDVYLSQYDEDGNLVIYSAAVGFEVKATKAEILALAEDPDVKLICSMLFVKDTDDDLMLA